MKPRLLDLFCGAGGATKGYQRAGFYVVGVDIKPQPRYCGDDFLLMDAMWYPTDLAQTAGFDAIHASPPCQDHVRARGGAAKHGTGWMLAETRQRLEACGLPWVIENVPGAPMRADYKLCGCQFGLRRLKRERWFETSWNGFAIRPPCDHPEPVISVTGTGTPTGTWKHYGSVSLTTFRETMGIDWMSRPELSQAIPPAYTEYIGRELLQVVGVGGTAHP